MKFIVSALRARRLYVVAALLVLVGVVAVPIVIANNPGLPIDQAGLLADYGPTHEDVTTQLDLGMLNASITGGDSNLEFALPETFETLDGETYDAADVYGMCYIGPYPFQLGRTSYDYKYFRRDEDVEEGACEIPSNRLMDEGYVDPSQGGFEIDRLLSMVRLDLWVAEDGPDTHLGTYDLPVGFERTHDPDETTYDNGGPYVRLPWLTEGPLYVNADSRRSRRATVVFKTNEASPAQLQLRKYRTSAWTTFDSAAATDHEVTIAGLRPDTRYWYRIKVGDLTSVKKLLRTPPRRSSRGAVQFAFLADSRAGEGGGPDKDFMGVNADVLDRLASASYARGDQFMLLLGDEASGETTSKVDFLQQQYAFKQVLQPYWSSRPVFPAVGNHEVVMNAYDDDIWEDGWVDKWGPADSDENHYDTESSEAAFAEAYWNRLDGPEPSDPRRPSYKENVFTTRRGMVMIINLNNNYMYNTFLWEDPAAQIAGGSGDGYIWQDQMDWLKEQLTAARKDRTVKYVFIAMHSPAFPNGGHVEDAMFWYGDNRPRGYTYDAVTDSLIPEAKGVIERRNELAKIACSSKKVVAVLSSDEHCYSRILISKRVPAGIPATSASATPAAGDMPFADGQANDDANRDGIINYLDDDELGPYEAASPLSTLRYPTWFIISGGAGAPFYGEEQTPWGDYWRAKKKPSDGYKYTSEYNSVQFRCTTRGVSLRVYNMHGELIDRIPNLMAAK